MSGQDNVTPLRRATANQQQDQVNLATGILGHRPWCDACRAHAADVLAALAGASIEDIADRGGR